MNQPNLVDRVVRFFRSGKQTAHTVEEISRLLKPTPGVLRAAIDVDNGDLVKACLGAGLEPTISDLKLAVSARCTARKGNARWYEYRERVVAVLKDKIQSHPELGAAFATDLGRILDASRCELLVKGVGHLSGMREMFPHVDIPETIIAPGERQADVEEVSAENLQDEAVIPGIRPQCI